MLFSEDNTHFFVTIFDLIFELDFLLDGKYIANNVENSENKKWDNL